VLHHLHVIQPAIQGVFVLNLQTKEENTLCQKKNYSLFIRAIPTSMLFPFDNFWQKCCQWMLQSAKTYKHSANSLTNAIVNHLFEHWPWIPWRLLERLVITETRRLLAASCPPQHTASKLVHFLRQCII